MEDKRDKAIIKPNYKKQAIFALCLIAIIVLFAILANIPAVAEYFFSRGVTRALSLLINRITNFLPFSLYEIIAVGLIILCPALVVLIIVFLCKKQRRRALKYLYRILLAVLFVLLSYFTLYGANYHREPVNRYLGITEPEVTQENLTEALTYYIDRLNETSAKLSRTASGNIVSPYSFKQLTDLLNDEYAHLNDSYFNDFTVRPKKVLLSVPMSYLGITGIYFPFVAEANINTNSPSYDLPCLLAHEMAHAKGVARENEANFVSYYICIKAENDYLNYSGLANATVNLLNALYATDQNAYEEMRERIDPDVLREWKNESAHYRKYDTFISSVSTFFNNLFLKSNGVPGGVASYGETTTSLVGLFDSMK